MLFDLSRCLRAPRVLLGISLLMNSRYKKKYNTVSFSFSLFLCFFSFPPRHLSHLCFFLFTLISCFSVPVLACLPFTRAHSLISSFPVFICLSVRLSFFHYGFQGVVLLLLLPFPRSPNHI